MSQLSGLRTAPRIGMRALWVVGLAALALLAGDAEARIHESSIQLDAENPWAYLTKFSYSRGSGNFTLEINSLKGEDVSENARFYLYLDEDWDGVMEAETCGEKAAMAKWASSSLRGQFHPLRHTVTQSIRPHFWYFVIADCQAASSSSSMSVKLTMFNADGTHLSHEDRAPARMIPVFAGVFLLAMIPLAGLVYISVQDSGALHPSIRNLILGLLLFFTTLVLETVNYRATLRSGRTLPLVDTAAEITSWLAQLVVSLELLGIAWAWSVDDMLSPSTKRRQKRSLLLRLVGLLVVLHVAFIILGRQYDGAHYKYHESETVWALGLIGMRLLLFVGFALGVHNLFTRESNLLQRAFLFRLALVGTVYFLSIPFVVGSASLFFAKYLRHQVVTIGSLTVQVASLVSLSVLLLTRNEFTEITTLSASSLPTSFKMA